MSDGADSLYMVDLILAAAETLSKQEAAASKVAPKPDTECFEEVCIDGVPQRCSSTNDIFASNNKDPDDPLSIKQETHDPSVIIPSVNAIDQLNTDEKTIHFVSLPKIKLDQTPAKQTRSAITVPTVNSTNRSSVSEATSSLYDDPYKDHEASNQSTKAQHGSSEKRSQLAPYFRKKSNCATMCETHSSHPGISMNRLQDSSNIPVPQNSPLITARSFESDANYATRRQKNTSLLGSSVNRTLGSNIITTPKTITKNRSYNIAVRSKTNLFNNMSIGPRKNDYSNSNPKKQAFSDQNEDQLIAHHGSLNLHSQFRGPWANLNHPGTDRGALRDISNYSTIHERRRLHSIRASYDSFSSDKWDEEPSFQRVHASTPLNQTSFALNLSLDENADYDDTPLNLVVTKPVTGESVPDQRRSSMVLDLRNPPQISPQLTPEKSRGQPQNEKHQTTQNKSYVPFNTTNRSSGQNGDANAVAGPSVGSSFHAAVLDDVEYEDYDDDDIDPDWLPDGDATLLNDLSIYEYFEKFKNDNLSDHDSDASSATEAEGTERNIQANGGEPQPKKSKSYLRKRNKNLKEKGLSYKRADGSIVPARRVQPPCSCRMRCSQKFSEPVRNNLLTSLLELTQSGQNQFLSSHITVVSTARPKVLVSRRTRSRIYRLPGVGGAVKVCKQMFLSTFDLKDRKIRVLADKLVLGAGIAKDDLRKDNISRKQIDPEHAEYIIKHIKSFPSEESHYGREKSSCLYVSSDLTIQRMYELYQDRCGMDNLIPVHYNTYRLAFKSLNIKFRKPKVDTCNTCDMLRVELQVEKDNVKREEIVGRKEAHQLEAERMYNEKKQDRVRANADISVRTISFDLQKQLATPYLTCGRAFYSRQLYTYNLTIFETTAGSNIPTCYIWDETRAKRGSREIGSCLWAYLKGLPACVEEINMYSDRCAGQNNNRTILFLMAYVVEMMASEGRKFTINHKFMTSGHSHMECDTIHSAIERAKKRTQVNIETPRDWSLLIASIKRNPPIIVKEMEQSQFLNWLTLGTRYTLPKFTTDNVQFKFKSARIFSCSTDTPGTVLFKHDVGDVNPKQIKLLTSKSVPLANLQFEPILTAPIQLPTAKLEDLRRLLPYVTQKWYYEAFLKTLKPPGRGKKPKISGIGGFDEDMDSDNEED